LLRVDGGPTQQIPAAASVWEDAIHELSLADGEHRLSLKVHGTARVYGVSLQRAGPGVIYDSLGILGCLDERLLGLNRAHWQTQLSQHAPHLVILMFGGNALSFPSFAAEAYARTFDKVLKLFREARPGASCLVVSPLDHGERQGGEIRTKPAVRTMIAIQRAAAFRNHCAYYSIFDAMGGEGTAARWSRSKPRLLSADLSHASHLGNRILGTLLHRALMSGFQKHLAGSSRRPSPMHSAR
jgi:lysophospholipase L1-like esterase